MKRKKKDLQETESRTKSEDEMLDLSLIHI